MPNPISMPTEEANVLTFDVVRSRSTARMQGRRTETKALHHPYWRASYSLTPNANVELGAVRRFLTYIGGFAAVDPTRIRPAAYSGAPLSGTRAIGGAFDGTSTTLSVANRLQPQIAGLPANFQLTAGDLIEFRQSENVRALMQLSADVVGNASGISTLTLDWALPETITTAAVVHLEKPTCVMQVMDANPEMVLLNSALSFTAEEIFPA